MGNYINTSVSIYQQPKLRRLDYAICCNELLYIMTKQINQNANYTSAKLK
jgi:hypothetical protein